MFRSLEELYWFLPRQAYTRIADNEKGARLAAGALLSAS
jgi:hypothetical protein